MSTVVRAVLCRWHICPFYHPTTERVCSAAIPSYPRWKTRLRQDCDFVSSFVLKRGMHSGSNISAKIEIIREMFNRIQKMLRVEFSTLFSVFGNVVKHGLSCLIYDPIPAPHTTYRYLSWFDGGCTV